MKVFKFPLKAVDEQRVSMQAGAKLLSAQMQGEQLCVWALIDETKSTVERTILVHGTGHDVAFPSTAQFVGTVQMYGGSLIFHVFALPESCVIPPSRAYLGSMANAAESDLERDRRVGSLVAPSDPSLAVECAYCGAVKGEPCRNTGNNAQIHSARKLLAGTF